MRKLSRRITACSGDDREGFFCSNGFQFACSNLTPFSCTTDFPWINRINGHFSYFCIFDFFETPGTMSKVLGKYRQEGDPRETMCLYHCLVIQRFNAGVPGQLDDSF